MEEKVEVEKIDLISGLPPEIIRSIISLLPLKDAARTSVLSGAWRNLWKPVDVKIDFDFDPLIPGQEASKDVIPSIHKFLSSQDGPWRLCVGFPKCLQMEDEWIVTATKVDFNFSGGEHPQRGFSLKLDSTPILHHAINSEVSCFASLRSLHFQSIPLLAEEIVPALFSNCPLLESLKLVRCSGLQKIDVTAGGFFQRFEIVDCPKVTNVTLSAPNLRSFRHHGILPRIEIKNCSNLIDAVLDFKQSPSDYDFDTEQLISLLAALKNVEILTLSGWLLQWLCLAGVIFNELEFQFNKLKELQWVGHSMNRERRDSIFCFLNITPSLERLFIDINPHRKSIPTPVFHRFWHEPHLWKDYPTLKASVSPLAHLQTVSVAGFTRNLDEVILMDLLFTKAVILQRMIIKSSRNNCWRVEKIPRNQLQETKRSRWEISVPSQENDYLYGFTEENCSYLSPEQGKL